MSAEYSAAFAKPELLDVIVIDGTLESAIFAAKEARRRNWAPDCTFTVEVDEETGQVGVRIGGYRDEVAMAGDVLVFTSTRSVTRVGGHWFSRNWLLHPGLPEQWMSDKRERVSDE